MPCPYLPALRVTGVFLARGRGGRFNLAVLRSPAGRGGVTPPPQLAATACRGRGGSDELGARGEGLRGLRGLLQGGRGLRGPVQHGGGLPPDRQRPPRLDFRGA